MEDERFNRKNTTVYNLSYHIIWCPKYRRKVLQKGVDTRLKELLHIKAKEREWTIKSLEVMPDHVHIFISASPNDSVKDIVGALKGFTARYLRHEFPYLRTKIPSMWTRSYYVESVGHISESTIKKYIADQKTSQRK